MRYRCNTMHLRLAHKHFLEMGLVTMGQRFEKFVNSRFSFSQEPYFYLADLTLSNTPSNKRLVFGEWPVKHTHKHKHKHTHTHTSRRFDCVADLHLFHGQKEWKKTGNENDRGISCCRTVSGL